MGFFGSLSQKLMMTCAKNKKILHDIFSLTDKQSKMLKITFDNGNYVIGRICAVLLKGTANILNDKEKLLYKEYIRQSKNE